MKALLPLGVLSAALLVVRSALPTTSATAAWSCAAGLLAAACVLLGAHRQRLPGASAWRLVALGVLLVPAADAPAALLDSGAGGVAGSAIRAAGIAALVLGFVRVRRHTSRGRDAAALLDTAVVVWAIAVCCWLLLGPAFLAAEPSERAQAALAAVGALVVLGVATRVLLDVGLRCVASVGLAAAVTCVVAAGIAEASVLLGLATPGWLPPVLAVLGALVLGLAVVHPSADGLSAPAEVVDSGLRGWRIAVVAAGAGVTAVAVAAHVVVPRDGAVLATVLASLVLLALLAGRTASIIGGYEQFVDREHVLRECSAALVAADTREDIGRAVQKAALELAGGPRQALVEVTFGARPDLTKIVNAVVAGSGPAVEAMRGQLRLTGALGRPGSARTIVAPIVVGERLAGMLRVTGRSPLTLHLNESVQTLAAQSVLALEGVAHAEARVAEESEARFRSLIQNSNDLIAIVDSGFVVGYVTPSVRSMLGYGVDEVVGRDLTSLLHPAEVDEVVSVLQHVAERGETAVHELRLRHRDDRWRVVEVAVGNMLTDLSVRGLVLTAHDVTDRRALEDQLAHQAFHDALSGLPNRALFGNRVDHAVDRAERTGGDIAVLFVDLDDFKTVNDSLGHGIGDELLVAVSRRLAGCLRAADTAARLGGDEFAMLLEDVGGIDGAVGVATRLLESLGQPIVVRRTELLVRASVGIVMAQPGQTTEEILRNADVAMYRAKNRGGHRFELFEPAMHEAALTRLQLKADLERAFTKGELHVEYQPIVALATGQVVSVEALLRWKHPERGPISPLEFVPLAEETGLIVEVGDWVLHQALRDTLGWKQLLPPDQALGISVNISGRQLQSAGFVERVARSLSETGVAPADVILEITESTLMDEVELVIARLAEVRRLGVRIAVDDFGTGFSSLGYLQRFPVDILKIAKPFVDELGDANRPARLVQAVIGLAGSLDLATIAEGIETDEQRAQLVELGCGLGQGYLFARPQRADAIRPLLRGQLAA